MLSSSLALNSISLTAKWKCLTQSLNFIPDLLSNHFLYMRGGNKAARSQNGALTVAESKGWGPFHGNKKKEIRFDESQTHSLFTNHLSKVCTIKVLDGTWTANFPKRHWLIQWTRLIPVVLKHVPSLPSPPRLCMMRWLCAVASDYMVATAPFFTSFIVVVTAKD